MRVKRIKKFKKNNISDLTQETDSSGRTSFGELNEGISKPDKTNTIQKIINTVKTGDTINIVARFFYSDC